MTMDATPVKCVFPMDYQPKSAGGAWVTFYDCTNADMDNPSDFWCATGVDANSQLTWSYCSDSCKKVTYAGSSNSGSGSGSSGSGSASGSSNSGSGTGSSGSGSASGSSNSGSGTGTSTTTKPTLSCKTQDGSYCDFGSNGFYYGDMPLAKSDGSRPGYQTCIQADSDGYPWCATGDNKWAYCSDAVGTTCAPTNWQV
eukprot:gb/GEZN01012031.1/.p1 GENE.gb/GEZN01012031.1/~~gb/GEZN01012031.1/.p1  ORF type:complete len:198 (-),score=3.62 gb/GEZN01012031.1/:214-807(-)